MIACVKWFFAILRNMKKIEIWIKNCVEIEKYKLIEKIKGYIQNISIALLKLVSNKIRNPMS